MDKNEDCLIDDICKKEIGNELRSFLNWRSGESWNLDLGDWNFELGAWSLWSLKLEVEACSLEPICYPLTFGMLCCCCVVLS